MNVLVLGGTGTVGSQVARELLARGVDVQILTRDANKQKSLPTGARPVIGDLLDPATVRSAFRGADGVFILNAVSPAETHEGLMAVNGARLGGAKRLVYLSVHLVDRAPHIPHLGSKLPIETAVKASGIPYTILRPNNFYQNDYWYRDVLLHHGLYPQPIGEVGLSRVDVRDIAEAAAAAFTQPGHEGQTYNLVGPDVMTGPGTAAAWSRALGKPITYGGSDLDAWETMAATGLPAWMAFDFRMMYQFFQAEGLKATPEDIDRAAKLVGHPPRSFEAFARETAEVWAREGSGVVA